MQQPVGRCPGRCKYRIPCPIWIHLVNDDLVANLSGSNDTEANLEALKELIAREASKSKLKTLFTLDRYKLKAAKSVEHLIELAKDDNKKCNRESMDHLVSLLKAHHWQVLFFTPHRRLLNETGLERIDDLMDPKLPILVGKCEQYHDEVYKQKLAKLDPKAKEVIELGMSSAVLNETRYDHILIVTKLAKKLDGEEYKRTLEAQNREAFIKYYEHFYQNNLLKRCRAYKKQMNGLMESVYQLDSQYDELHIPKNGRTEDFLLGQNRWKLCSLMEPYKWEKDRLIQQAIKIFNDYMNDVKYKWVNWDPLPTETRIAMGRRLY